MCNKQLNKSLHAGNVQTTDASSVHG